MGSRDAASEANGYASRERDPIMGLRDAAKRSQRLRLLAENISSGPVVVTRTICHR